MHPLILTLALHPDDQARFDALRRAHFPAERNLIPAHCTLFHHLPGTEAETLPAMLDALCRTQPACTIRITGLRNLGRGVAYTLDAPEPARLRTHLARHFHDSLTNQDRQSWRPHITIQNKAPQAEAATLLAHMQATFTPFTARAEGLTLWDYLGGPWQQRSHHPFVLLPSL